MRFTVRFRTGVLVGTFLVLLAASPSGGAEPEELRVGTSGDYAPFSVRDESGSRSGLDVALAEAFAQDSGMRLAFVPFRWPELAQDLEAGRFDLAWSGVTVRPERSLVGAYAVPTLASGAVVLVGAESPLRSATDLQRPGLRIAVNGGGHLERVARRLLPAAAIVPLPDNALVPAALAKQEVDAVMTDTVEAPHWNRSHGAGSWRAIGPLTRDLKAPLVAPARQDLRRRLDRWLLEAERDGTLAALRGRWLGGADSPPTARPTAALLAAIAERLALMPDVARAKHRAGTPIRVPEREAVVLAAAVESAGEAARRSGRALQADAAIEAFFRTLIDAAVSVQEAEPATSPAAGGPELDVIRPALIRIGDRIALLLPYLPDEIRAEDVERELAALVQVDGIDAAMRRRLAEAVVGLAQAPRKQP